MVDSINLGTGVHRLKVRNFRSFQDLTVDLQRLNFIVGANASGKTNVLHAFKFLRDSAADGLDDAVSLQGGIDFLTHVRHRSEPFELEVSYSEEGVSKGLHLLLSATALREVEFRNPRSTYYLKLSRLGATDYEIRQDKLIIHFECFSPDFKQRSDAYLERHAVLTLDRRPDKINLILVPPEAFKIQPSPVLEYVRDTWAVPSRATLFDEVATILDFRPSAFFREVKVFDLEPTLASEAIFVTGKTNLDEDGENLPIVLRKILGNANDQEKYVKLLRNLLPYIENVDVETYSDLSAVIRIADRFTHELFPGPMLSAGTVAVTALIVALYFEPSPVIMIEEPERFLHAALIDKMVSLLKSRSVERQFVITTHDSSLIRAVDESSVYGVYRDNGGYSRIFRPSENEQIQQFLAEEMGFDALNSANMLHE